MGFGDVFRWSANPFRTVLSLTTEEQVGPLLS